LLTVGIHLRFRRTQVEEIVIRNSIIILRSCQHLRSCSERTFGVQ
jgi:hypothetical protein